MTLDVVVPTYNRATLLIRLLHSLRAAAVPDGLRVRTVIVDNNSTDNTAEVIHKAQRDWPGTLEYRFEPIQSRSAALNNGVSASDAELVGMVDDDEEIHPDWFAVAAATLRDSRVDFISGPYLPRWGAPPPEWLPREYPGVIGWVEAGDRVLKFGADTGGVLLGGNAVVRRSAGEAAGWYNVAFGNSGAKVGGSEDFDFFERLMLLGSTGYYVPRLIIYHYVPPSRLTKRYHRHWCFRRAMNQAQVDAIRPPDVAHVFGIPRYMVGTAARATLGLIRSPFSRTRTAADVFAQELKLWELAGYARGRLALQS